MTTTTKAAAEVVTTTIQKTQNSEKESKSRIESRKYNESNEKVHKLEEKISK